MDFELILSKAQNYCSRSEKCKSDVISFLNKQKIESSIVNNVIQLLEKDDFINHERYASAYVNDAFKFNKWGKLKIRQTLIHKGIETVYINNFLSEIDEDEYISLLENLMQAKFKTLKYDDEYKKKAALIRFAVSRGFEMDYIDKILNKKF